MKSTNSKHGSTLLVTLLVTSLLMVMVLSFTVYVRMELRTVETRMQLQTARQHAKLAMQLAIGQLQLHAGPDQRSTARAEILGPSVTGGNRFWTGVWTQNPAGGVAPNPVWLVSGTAPDPISGAGSDSITLFPAINGDSEIRAALEPLEDLDNLVRGKFAYWVSDEGTKASVQGQRHRIPLYETAGLTSRRPHTEYLVGFGVDLDPFFTTPDIDLTDTLLPLELEKATTLSQLPFALDSSGSPFAPSSSQIDHHDLTPLSLGVLENASDGGLKKNLSDSSFRDSFLATDETQAFLAPKSGALTVESGLPSDRGVSEGDPYFSPRPILTEAVLYMGLFHTRSDAKIRIRYHMQAEFLNPYSLPLVFPRDGDSRYDRGLALIFDNLPTVTIEDLSGVGPTLTEDLNAISSYGPTDSRHTINSWFEISALNTSNIPELKAGEIYQVMEPDPSTQPRGLARDFTTTRWSASASTRPADNAQIRITAAHPASGVTIRAVPYASSSNPVTRDTIFSLNGLRFDDFELLKRFNSGPNPFSRPTSSSYLVDDYIFAYHFRPYSDESDPTSMRDYLTGIDLRDPILNTSDTYTDVNGTNQTFAALQDPISTNPPSIVQDTLNLFSGLDQLHDGTARDHTDDYRITYLIDVPNGDALSVGQLSSLHLYKRAPRSIGNPWGGYYNQAFDRYYFSPKLLNPSTSTPTPASPAITTLQPPSSTTANEDDAANELVHGLFNINSTSVKAWEAVLGAPILTPTAYDEASTGDVKRHGTFFRMPEYQSGNPAFAVTHTEIENPSQAFAQGVRHLEEPNGRQQIRELASEIVTALVNKGEPFSDMSEFINSGILLESVDNVNSLTAAPLINENLIPHSNVYLTQADILTKLAPMTATRSDTFKIRAYGNVTDTNGKIISQAVCEVWVQRTPEKIDGSNPMTAANTLLNSRTFTITSFRWLTHDEI
jgi:hypothetical protein